MKAYFKNATDVKADEYPLVCSCHSMDKCITVKKADCIVGRNNTVICPNCGRKLGVMPVKEEDV